MSDILTPSRKHLIHLSCWCWCLLFPRSLLVFFLFIFFSTTIVGVIVHGLVCLLGTLSPPVVLYCPTNTILPSLDLHNCTTAHLHNTVVNSIVPPLVSNQHHPSLDLHNCIVPTTHHHDSTPTVFAQLYYSAHSNAHITLNTGEMYLYLFVMF